MVLFLCIVQISLEWHVCIGWYINAYTLILWYIFHRKHRNRMFENDCLLKGMIEVLTFILLILTSLNIFGIIQYKNVICTFILKSYIPLHLLVCTPGRASSSISAVSSLNLQDEDTRRRQSAKHLQVSKKNIHNNMHILQSYRLLCDTRHTKARTSKHVRLHYTI